MYINMWVGGREKKEKKLKRGTRKIEVKRVKEQEGEKEKKKGEGTGYL